MYQLSTKGRYGTRLMYQLAKNYGQGPMLLKEIAKKEDLSVKYMEQIIVLLKQANFITSLRGPYGGYTLNKAPSEINMKELLEVLEGDISPVDCVDNPIRCQKSDHCAAHNVWQILESKINHTLEEISLQDMLEMNTT